jgi:hypothetical protein
MNWRAFLKEFHTDQTKDIKITKTFDIRLCLRAADRRIRIDAVMGRPTRKRVNFHYCGKCQDGSNNYAWTYGPTVWPTTFRVFVDGKERGVVDRPSTAFAVAFS